MNDFLSYKQIMLDRIKFRQAGGVHGSDFNGYDFPEAKYFKVLFHFYNDPTVGGLTKNGSGLLHPTWNDTGFQDAWAKQIDHTYRADEYIPWRYNTAYSYLITNEEMERAAYLKQFISLLSNISSESPWYFKSVKGIEEAINRKQFTEEFSFKDRGRLVIECLPDAVDERIGTLMDLYRAATYSWVNKREVIPTNLRKFDMSVIVYQVPIMNMHIPKATGWRVPEVLGELNQLLEDNDGFATLNSDSSSPLLASYKIYEFHNCEFDYNSTIAAGDGLTNEEPFSTTYNIAIFYDDMYEIRYNQFITPPQIVYGNHIRFNRENWLEDEQRAKLREYYDKNKEKKAKEEQKSTEVVYGEHNIEDTKELDNVNVIGQYTGKNPVRKSLPELYNMSGINVPISSTRTHKLTDIYKAPEIQGMQGMQETLEVSSAQDAFSLTEIGDLVLVDSLVYDWDSKYGEPEGGSKGAQLLMKLKSDPDRNEVQENSLLNNKLGDKVLGNLFGLSINDIGSYKSVTDNESASVLKYNYNGHGNPDQLKNIVRDYHDEWEWLDEIYGVNSNHAGTGHPVGNIVRDYHDEWEWLDEIYGVNSNHAGIGKKEALKALGNLYKTSSAISNV